MVASIFAVPLQANASEVPVTVVGTREVGEVLHLQDTNTWDIPPEIQWLRDFVPIEGANSTTYQLEDRDYLRSITVRLLGSLQGVPKVRFSLPISRTGKGSFAGILGEQRVGVASNHYHTCVAQLGGYVQCAGPNLSGQLGNGEASETYQPITTPVTVKDLSEIVSISTNSESTCAVTVMGLIKCWGNLLYVDGTEEITLKPKIVVGAENAIDLAQGGRHNCALLTQGFVSCWGLNRKGQLGDGTLIDRPSGLNVPSIEGAVHVALTSGSSCALLFDGSVSCWGNNYHGELGIGSTINSSRPVRIENIPPVIKISGGGQSMCALLETRTASCWGSNEYFQGGVRDSLEPILEPREVQGLENILNLHTGGDRSCVIKEDKTLWCWGFGALGDGTRYRGPDHRTIDPVKISGTGEIESVFVGECVMCVVSVDGVLKCWGDGAPSGVGTEIAVEVPTSTLFNRWLTKKAVPAVAGAPRVGSILVANSGLWDTGVTLSYQWLSNGNQIESATSDSYLVSNEQAGKNISLFIEASKEGFLSHFTESASTPIITGGKIAAPTSLAITGTAKFGESLSATSYFWDPTVTLSYTWQREGSSSVLGRGQNYVVGAADVGKRIRLTLVATKLGHDTVSLITPYSPKIALRTFTSPPTPIIAGTLKVGKSVTATLGVWLDNPTLSYQWLLDGKPISKATKATLKLPSSAKNKKLSVRVTATKSGYASVSKTSSTKKVT
jgi:alpha-tubulin suppressor-like RCC1 family protein